MTGTGRRPAPLWAIASTVSGILLIAGMTLLVVLAALI
jgi:hypothetical protein